MSDTKKGDFKKRLSRIADKCGDVLEEVQWAAVDIIEKTAPHVQLAKARFKDTVVKFLNK